MPIDYQHLHAFVCKCRRVYELADTAQIRVIEVQKVTQRRDITDEISGDEIQTPQQDRIDIIRRILELHENAGESALHSYHAARSLFDFDAFGPPSDVVDAQESYRAVRSVFDEEIDERHSDEEAVG